MESYVQAKKKLWNIQIAVLYNIICYFEIYILCSIYQAEVGAGVELCIVQQENRKQFQPVFRLRTNIRNFNLLCFIV